MNNYSCLQASDVPKLFGKHICLVAPSKSGKTTLCRSIAQMANKTFKTLDWSTKKWESNVVYELDHPSYAPDLSEMPFDSSIVFRSMQDFPKEKDIVKYDLQYIILGQNCQTKDVENCYNMLAPVLPVDNVTKFVNSIRLVPSFTFTVIDLTMPVRNGDKECEIFQFKTELQVAAQHSLLFADLKKKIIPKQIECENPLFSTIELNVREFKPEKADLFGKVMCCVGWSKSGKTVAIQSMAFECNTEYLASSLIGTDMKPCFIETSGLSELDIRQAKSKHCIVESCGSLTCTKPDMRQFVEYIIICGKLPKRELDRIYEFYEHIFPVGKQIFYEIVEKTNFNYRCTVIDISYPVRQGLKKGEIYWYEDKHLVAVTNNAE